MQSTKKYIQQNHNKSNEKCLQTKSGPHIALGNAALDNE